MASDLLFSQVREDPLLDLQVVDRVAARRGAPARVLLVASGGCTAVSMLAADSVAEVHAIDANPAQLHLTALRQQAALRLPPADVRVLLGESMMVAAGAPDRGPVAGEGDDGARRLALYRELAGALPAAARAHWDARADEVRFGVNRVGRFEELFRELARALAGRGLDPLADALGAVSSPGWRASFQQVFERRKLAEVFGEEAVVYSMDRSFADHFEHQFARALGRYRVTDNYFLSQVLCDCYRADQGPPYLADTFRAAASRLGGDRLHLHAGRFADRLAELAAPAKFDVIQLSNISDWMPPSELDALLARVRACLTPGGAVIGRRLNGDHVLMDLVARHFEVDRALCAALLEQDRSFFYREVVAGWA